MESEVTKIANPKLYKTYFNKK